jgi:hypothetical protein
MPPTPTLSLVLLISLVILCPSKKYEEGGIIPDQVSMKEQGFPKTPGSCPEPLPGEGESYFVRKNRELALKS